MEMGGASGETICFFLLVLMLSVTSEKHQSRQDLMTRVEEEKRKNSEIVLSIRAVH